MQFNQNDPDYLMGMQHYLSGEWEETEKTFKSLHDKYPESTFILLILGNTYDAMGRLGDAIETYKRAAKISPDYFVLYYRMGVCAYRSGKLEEALLYFKMVNENDRHTYAMATYFTGLINFFLGNEEEASANFEILKKESKESKIANYFLAQLKLNSDEIEESISLLEELLEVTPDFADLYYFLGNAYYKKHDIIKAIKCIQKAMELNPSDKKSKEMMEILTIPA